MTGEPLYALGLFSSALGAAVARVPWVAVAAIVAAIPYLAIGVIRALEGLRAKQRPVRPAR
jgi:hypothetical protein